jgi:putative IMPACT (imprinted ancient) family translation regulator
MRELDKTNSDESKIVNIVKNYKDKASFKNFVDQYKAIAAKDFGAADVARAIQPFNDPTEWEDLAKSFENFRGLLQPGSI